MFLSARRGAYGRIFALIVKLTPTEHYQAYSKLIVFISFCGYDATISELAPNQPVNTDFSEMLFTNDIASLTLNVLDGYTMILVGMLDYALFA